MDVIERPEERCTEYRLKEMERGTEYRLKGDRAKEMKGDCDTFGTFKKVVLHTITKLSFQFYLISKSLLRIMACHLQSDIRLLGNTFTSYPRIVPGRMSGEDFVFFTIPPTVDASKYMVIVQANDTAGPEWRSIGPLRKTVHLPEVHFGAHGHIAVIPECDPNARLPRFWGRLNRGSTYVIPTLRPCDGGVFQMDRHGIMTASVNSAPWMGGEH